MVKRLELAPKRAKVASREREEQKKEKTIGEVGMKRVASEISRQVTNEDDEGT